jgi:murein DD-endopeptidase MepM/ murein hydrolase activator NlpD
MPLWKILFLLFVPCLATKALAEVEYFAATEIKLYSRISVNPSEPNGIQLFTIPEGSKVIVRTRSGNWVLVETPEGKGGWARKEDILERAAADPEGPSKESGVATNNPSNNENIEEDNEEEDGDTDLYDCLEELQKIAEPAEALQVIAALEKKFPGISFTSPIKGRECILSGRRFGCYMHPILKRPMAHEGIDLAAKAGTELVAPTDGCELVTQQWSGSFGRQVFLRCGVYSFSYNHLSAYANKGRNRQGHKYAKGEVIGYVGTSGRSTGPHLHLEVFQNGNKIDPNSLFDESVLCKGKRELQATTDCSKAPPKRGPKRRGTR